MRWRPRFGLQASVLTCVPCECEKLLSEQLASTLLLLEHWRPSGGSPWMKECFSRKTSFWPHTHECFLGCYGKVIAAITEEGDMCQGVGGFPRTPTSRGNKHTNQSISWRPLVSAPSTLKLSNKTSQVACWRWKPANKWRNYGSNLCSLLSMSEVVLAGLSSPLIDFPASSSSLHMSSWLLTLKIKSKNKTPSVV